MQVDAAWWAGGLVSFIVMHDVLLLTVGIVVIVSCSYFERDPFPVVQAYNVCCKHRGRLGRLCMLVCMVQVLTCCSLVNWWLGIIYPDLGLETDSEGCGE